MKKFLSFVICSLILMVYFPVYGKSLDKGQLINQDNLKLVESYLNNLTTFTADFYQVTNRGEEAKGKFLLSRPGKIRWEYDAPTQILIVGRGNLVAYYDKELDEVSYINLKDTIAGFLTKDKIDLQKDTKILNTHRNNATTEVTFSPKVMKEQDRISDITLSFSNNPLIMTGISVTDNVGKITTLKFTNIKQGDNLLADAFNYPRTKTLRR